VGQREGGASVWCGGGAPVHLDGDDWVLGHRGHERGEGEVSSRRKAERGKSSS
jgi:hypothetical protein